MLRALLLPVFAALSIAASAAEPKALAITEKGIAVPVEGLETVTISWPALAPKDGYSPAIAATAQQLAKAGAKLTYPGDVTVTVRLAKNEIEYGLSKLPDGISGLRVDASLPGSIRTGWSWTLGDKGGPFPADKPDKPHLCQASNTVKFELLSGASAKLAIEMPAYSYQELVDLREWKTNGYKWMAIFPLTSDKLVGRVVVKR